MHPPLKRIASLFSSVGWVGRISLSGMGWDVTRASGCCCAAVTGAADWREDVRRRKENIFGGLVLEGDELYARGWMLLRYSSPMLLMSMKECLV